MPQPNSNFLDRDGNPIGCSRPPKLYSSRCLVCDRKTIIHCDECTTQVSGCACTLIQRLKKELREDAPPHN